jgi:hypothetical protein
LTNQTTHTYPQCWQEVRLFISSTFRDMHAERDYLVRYVFPRVREELLKRRLYFIDIDLRWGLTTEDDVIGACRSIIDECRPLFLAILGGRYGWVPEQHPKAISVTEDEIDHAIRNIQVGEYQKVLFLFRDDTTTSSMRESFPDEFCEPSGSVNERKLAELKKRINQSGYPVRFYNASWNDSTHSLTKLNIFGQMVYDYILSFVEETCGPYHPEHISNEDDDDMILELFINQRNRFFITTGLEDFFFRIESQAFQQRKNNVILVTGERGIGKSAFLCKFIERSLNRSEIRIFPHFIGINLQSTRLDGTLKRLCRLLAIENQTHEPIPHEIDQLILYFQRSLINLHSEIRYVLVIDGINQLESNYNAHALHWLPQSLPDNVTVILSTPSDSLVQTIQQRWPTLQVIELPGFNPDASRSMVDYYLSRYQKRLSSHQINQLLGKPGSHIPLYLASIVEELRIFGDYEHLTDFIRNLPGETVALLEWIITARLAQSNEFVDDTGQKISAALVRQYLSYLYISRNGLSEIELTGLLSSIAFEGNVAALTRQLRAFLTYRGELLTFYHEDIRIAVSQSCVKQTDLIRLHREMAAFFKIQADPAGDSSWSTYSARPFEQLLYHCLKADDPHTLASLIDNRFLENYAKHCAPVPLMHEIRTIIKTLSADQTKDHWNVVVHCVKFFAELSQSILTTPADQPHPLERAIAEERFNDVESLLASFSQGPHAAALRCAARELFLAGGYPEKAGEIDTYPSKITEKANSSTKLLYEALAFFRKIPLKRLATSSSIVKNTGQIQEKDTLKSITGIKPRRTVPIWQIIALTSMGPLRIFLGLAVGILAFLLLVMHYPQAPYQWLEFIKHWAALQTHDQKTIIVGVATIVFGFIFGLPVFIIPMTIVNLLGMGLTNALKRTSKSQILAMVSGINLLPLQNRLRPVLKLVHFEHLLLQANIGEEHWNDPAVIHIINTEFIYLINESQTRNAGLLAACILNLESQSRSSMVEAFRTLPDNTLYEIMSQMLHHRFIIRKGENVLDCILKIYRHSPPVPLILSSLRLQRPKSEPFLIGELRHINRSILASCLLRSFRSNPKTWWSQLLMRSKFIFQLLFDPAPVSLSWYEPLIKVPFFALLLVLLIVGYFFGYLGYLLSLLFIAYVLSPLLLRFICFEWRDKQNIPLQVEAFQNALLFNPDSKKATDSPSTAIRGSSAVETALIQKLIQDLASSQKILQNFSSKVTIRVWNHILRIVDSAKRITLLLEIMDKDVILPKILKRIPTHKPQFAQPVNELEHHRQWERVRPATSSWIWSLRFILVSVLCCMLSIGITYQLADPWLRLLMRRWGLLIVIPTLYAGFIPIRKIRYLSVGFSIMVSLLILLPESWFLNTDELFLYSWFPALAVLVANEALTQWYCTRTIYPNFYQRLLQKLKSFAVFSFGATIIGIGFICLMQIHIMMGEEETFSPEKSIFASLKNFSIIKQWPERPAKLRTINPGERLETVIGIGSNYGSLYGRKLAGRIRNGKLLYWTYLSLARFGYPSEANFCKHRMMSYIGWCANRKKNSNGRSRTIFLNDAGQQVPVKVVFTDVILTDQAKSLGIKSGDIIESINDRPVSAPEDIYQGITESDKNKHEISMVVRRDKTRLRLSARPGSLNSIDMGLGFICPSLLDE